MILIDEVLITEPPKSQHEYDTSATTVHLSVDYAMTWTHYDY